jgi:uncharacterized protein YukE
MKEERTMSLLGMDVHAVRNLATQLAAKADEIDSITNALSGQLDSVQWLGPDADGFRSEWNSLHRSKLHLVANALRDASTSAIRNANQQQEASGA